MPVSERVREVESEIDASIRALPIWRAPKAEVLEQIMVTYRDAIELTFLEGLSAETLDIPLDEMGEVFAKEDHLRSGVLWALKWASEYCPEGGRSAARSPKELVDLTFLGTTYEALVDALKCAKWDLITIEVDESSRIVTCYEGGNSTGFDVQITERARISAPHTAQASLTANDDRLTSRWTAGDYCRVVNTLAGYGTTQENTLLVDANFLAMIGKAEISAPQPTVVWLDRPSREPDCYVFDDLVLPTTMDSTVKWKLVSLLDTPIVMVGDRYCALSTDLKALSGLDDYMLRLAARVDNDQYNRSSLLREGRMIQICKNTLKHCAQPWAARDRVVYSNPSEEADILATRDSQTLILQLKSTLRPQTPWEVYKRNQDVIHGVKQTSSIVDRSTAAYGFVVTDGYRGDSASWLPAPMFLSRLCMTSH